jgi:proteasome beta subunit
MDNELKKHVLKTGTTTIGIVTKEGIVLAADKQGSYGDSHGGVHYIAGEMEKIKAFNDNILLTISGTATFALRAIKQLQAEIRLKELKDKKKATMKEIANLFSIMALQSLHSGGAIGFIMAGKENGEAKLYEISPDGILKDIDTYKISGSGMMHVNSILDTEYKKGLNLEEGIQLVKRCIKGSAGRDPATGIGYEIWTITPDKLEKVENKLWELD